ncbi:MAG: hypothetical protein EHM13_00625 [Acidobacteria bacterium]|nr:MAG: hypothetical protein EHM13_00625 [Acidobacteriota bacterium]
MTTAAYLVLAIAAVIAGFFIVQFVRRYQQLKGTRLVSCPENQQTVAVEVDSKRAALAAVVGKPRFELTECTRWPENKACGRQCLSQIEAAPFDCLVRTKLNAWYQGKSCGVCGKKIGPIEWHHHRPALLRPDRATVEWQDLEAERLDEILLTHSPVCWNCHVIETFRRTHPDRVVENPWRLSQM